MIPRFERFRMMLQTQNKRDKNEIQFPEGVRFPGTTEKHLDQNRRVRAEIDEIKVLFQQKNDQYWESPVEILPVESWLHQIRIKAERALQATGDEKRKEELRDCAVYCLLTLAKMESNEKTVTNPVTGTKYPVRERTSKTPRS